MTTKLRRNRKLLNAVAACIETWPEEYDQWRAFIEPRHGAEPVDIFIEGDGTFRGVTCGSTECIAGWALVLSGHKECPLLPSATAAGLLGLTWDEGAILFESGWAPPGLPSMSPYSPLDDDGNVIEVDKPTPQERADAVAAELRRIANGGEVR